MFRIPIKKLLGNGYVYLLIISILYTIVWSYISISGYLAFSKYVFDLGIVMERSWLIFHTAWSAMALVKEFLFSGIVFVVSPFFVVGGYKFILVFQSLFIGFTSLPLFYIGNRFLKSRLASFLIAVSFLIYFPLAGVNWYDFHYQAMFIPLFISGYALYLRGNTKLSILLLFLSGITRYPYVIFPMVLSLWITVETYLSSRKSGKSDTRKVMVYLIFSLVLIAQLTVTYILYSSSSGLAIDIHLQSNIGFIGSLFYHFDTKIQTILLFLFPVLGFTLLSKKWSFFLIPGFLVILFSTNGVYLFPRTFMMQYAAGIAPFIFLGLIEGLASHTSSSDIKEKENQIQEKASGRRQVKVAATILIVIALLGTVYLPYGPFNSHTTVDYHLNTTTNANLTMDSEMAKLISLMPKSEGSVLIQNNIPQLLPRPTVNGTVLVPGVNVLYNMTYQTQSGSFRHVDPKFILEYPFGNYFKYQGKYPYNISMYKIMSSLYSGSNYGILGEASDMMLLEKGYNGPLKYYVPYIANLSPAEFNIPSTSHISNGLLETNNSVSDTFTWYGPYTTLVPGRYNITYYLSTTNSSAQNRIDLSVTANIGSVVLSSKTVSGTEITKGLSETPVTQTVNIDSLYSYVEFSGWTPHWAGSVILHSVRIQQLSPVPVVSNSPLISLIPNGSSVLAQRPYIPLFNSSLVYDVSSYQPSDSPSYIVGDINQGKFWSSGGNSIESIVKNAILSGDYGVRAESGGMILLQKGYTGNTSYFRPYTRWIPGSSFFPGPQSYARNDSIYLSSTSVGSAWYGPYINLLPGNYSVTAELHSSNISSLNHATVQVTANDGSTIIKNVTFNGSSFSSSNNTAQVRFSINLAYPLSLVEFKGINVTWQGTLQLEGMRITQSQ